MSALNVTKKGYTAAFHIFSPRKEDGLYRVDVTDSDSKVVYTRSTMPIARFGKNERYSFHSFWLITLSDDELKTLLEDIIDHTIGYVADIDTLDAKFGIDAR